MFDLCVLYHQGNGQLLSKMIENIFTQQPKYNDDLVQTIQTLSLVCYYFVVSGNSVPDKNG